MTSRATAPSLICEEFPAVTVPYWRSNTGFNFASAAERRIGPRTIVLGDRFAIEVNRADFLGKFFARGDGALMRLHGKFILRLPTDPVFTGKDFGGFTHVQSADRIGEAELQGDARLEIGEAEFSQRRRVF